MILKREDGHSSGVGSLAQLRGWNFRELGDMRENRVPRQLSLEDKVKAL